MGDLDDCVIPRLDDCVREPIMGHFQKPVHSQKTTTKTLVPCDLRELQKRESEREREREEREERERKRERGREGERKRESAT